MPREQRGALLSVQTFPLLHQEYDAGENIVFVSHPRAVHLDSSDEVTRYFDAVVDFWQQHCEQRRAYYLVDWKGFSLNLREAEVYSRNVQRVIDHCSIAIVRYGTDALRRAATRLMALKQQVPSNVYETRDEAMEFIRELKELAKRCSAR